MGKLLLIVLAAIAAFMVLSVVISALHFIFWVAVVALIVVVGLRLTGGARRWRLRYPPGFVIVIGHPRLPAVAPVEIHSHP